MTEQLIRELIDATYDTGHYAGDGRSGTDLHKDRIKDREALRDKLAARVTAAAALATEVSPAIEIVKAACIYINMIGTGGERDERVIKALRTISGDLHTALRKYRETELEEEEAEHGGYKD